MPFTANDQIRTRWEDKGQRLDLTRLFLRNVEFLGTGQVPAVPVEPTRTLFERTVKALLVVERAAQGIRAEPGRGSTMLQVYQGIARCSEQPGSRDLFPAEITMLGQLFDAATMRVDLNEGGEIEACVMGQPQDVYHGATGFQIARAAAAAAAGIELSQE